ncbi:hypothetical protein ACFW04_009513 [Cataglyphis niger]
MSAQKFVFSLAFTIAVLLAVNTVPANGAIEQQAANKSNHLIVGSRVPGDRLVLRQNVFKNSSWMKKTNGNGATASLLKGGPGFNNVTLRFKSQRGHSINHVVELYAY